MEDHGRELSTPVPVVKVFPKVEDESMPRIIATWRSPSGTFSWRLVRAGDNFVIERLVKDAMGGIAWINESSFKTEAIETNGLCAMCIAFAGKL